MKLLSIGGSGFLSGTLARFALEAGHQVWTVTRGSRPVPEGVTPIIADRKDSAAFQDAIEASGESWDLVVDCIGFVADDARQDIEVFRHRARHLVFISTDFVIDPQSRRFPQNEKVGAYAASGYGFNKRQCEMEILKSKSTPLQWTILRPCHIYGPGSLLGCLPAHSRDAELITTLKASQPLQLVGGGHFLQQPILASDLARLIISCADNTSTYGQIFVAAGPEIVESQEYFRIIAEELGVALEVEELSVSEYVASHPESAPFLCHRIYDLSKLHQAHLAVPSTSLRDGLRDHVQSLL